ncbi:four-carbon acid sugar kinase family protein [Flavobacterium cellulosilyticum]|uniref:Four-carbon acid sugar kinase family protein n=1 Tax=Flavobacterium cellulosilyticum TaxID=2541731 RepID=A0A4R5CCR2_9FLAO|nr:four-carbon acid sugar kinase family protein [Flavobacterium cellulosilyticum]TDD97791.1 four-carbon acid sugar kinase family protein [Flavobacterium cellulosilyticum]
MKQKEKVLLAYYGDDFTGSTDALEFLTLAGVKTVLFLRKPQQKDLERFPGIQAIGLAGKSRSLSPLDMETELFPAFENLKSFEPAHVHYKVCSTFDSAPHVGNIGKAIEIGSEVFNQKTVLVSPSAPHLGRFCVFGNLFARMGTTGNGEIYRIDRHPSMRKHPVTPALEGDLRLHLAKQTSKSIGLVNLTTIEKGTDAVLEAVANNQAEILFFDGVNEGHLSTIGNVFNQLATAKTVFSVGSSGIEMALGLAWKKEKIIGNKIAFEPAGEAAPLLVLSGSCSPVTSDQIEYALKNGFEGIALDSKAVDSDYQEAIIKSTAAQIVANFNKRKSTVLHTSTGADDPRIAATELFFKSKGIAENDIQQQCSSIYGKVLGQITKEVLAQVKIKRILFAGGDTSSYAASELDILALEMIAPLAPGAPLCKAISDDTLVNGLELNFKGGQVGTPDYFIKVVKGEKL